MDLEPKLLLTLYLRASMNLSVLTHTVHPHAKASLSYEVILTAQPGNFSNTSHCQCDLAFFLFGHVAIFFLFLSISFSDPHPPFINVLMRGCCNIYIFLKFKWLLK